MHLSLLYFESLAIAGEHSATAENSVQMELFHAAIEHLFGAVPGPPAEPGLSFARAPYPLYDLRAARIVADIQCSSM